MTSPIRRERDPAGIEIIPTSIMSWPFGQTCYYAGAHTARRDTHPTCVEGTLTRSNLSSPARLSGRPVTVIDPVIESDYPRRL